MCMNGYACAWSFCIADMNTMYSKFIPIHIYLSIYLPIYTYMHIYTHIQASLLDLKAGSKQQVAQPGWRRHLCFSASHSHADAGIVAWRRKAEMPAWHSEICWGCATISCCRPSNPGEKLGSFEIARKCLDEIWNQDFTQLNLLLAKMAMRGFQISPGYARDTPVTHPWHSRDTSGFFRDTPGSQDSSPGPEFLSRIKIYSFPRFSIKNLNLCVPNPLRVFFHDFYVPKPLRPGQGFEPASSGATIGVQRSLKSKIPKVQTHIHTHTHTRSHRHARTRVCVCVCVCSHFASLFSSFLHHASGNEGVECNEGSQQEGGRANPNK